MHARRIEARGARRQPGRVRALRLLALGLAPWLAVAGCAGLAPSRDLVAAALAARGGPLPRFARSADLEVYAGFPGAWRWEVGYEVPERLRVTLETSAETQTLVSDGSFVRTYVGSGLVSQEPAHASGVAALVSFVALSDLDVLDERGRATWQPLAAALLPAGAAQGLRARLAATPDADFELGFDAALRLVRLAGPVTIPGIGDGVLEAHFEDFREVEGLWLPFAIHYRFRGAPLLDERVREWRVGAAPEIEDFSGPRRPD